jgi:Cu+-exporting ATPase
LSEDEQRGIRSLACHSTHPLSVRIAESLTADFTEPVRSFSEITGRGIEGTVAGREILLGSAQGLESRGVAAPRKPLPQGSIVHLAIDGVHRGCFVLESALRREVDSVISKLSQDYELTLLSGDNEKQRDTFAPMFAGRMEFNQSPLDKLEFIHGLQRAGKRVMMVGDGLNDSGALKQSDVGVAVVENVSAFSPASDVIMSAAMVSQLDAVLRFSRRATGIVRLSFALSSLYNVIGISIAAGGLLAPIVCAILMPISSVSVVAFACGATAWVARRELGGRANLVATAASAGEPAPVS